MLAIPPLIRIPVFVALLVLSLIVLGLDGHLVSALSFSIPSESVFGIVTPGVSIPAPSWTKLGVATAVLTIVSIGPMLVIDFLRKGAPTSWIVVELSWIGFLVILWLATASDTAANTALCSSVYVTGNSLCSEIQAAEAFAFLAWLTSLAYFVILLVFSILAHSAGNSRIWFSSVRDGEWQQGKGGAGAPGVGGVAPGPYAGGEGAGAGVAQYPPTNV